MLNMLEVSLLNMFQNHTNKKSAKLETKIKKVLNSDITERNVSRGKSYGHSRLNRN